MKRGAKSRKSQAATEYLILFGAIFLVIFAILYYSIENTNQTIKMNNAIDTVSTLAKTADAVYALGPGSQDFVQVNMPGSVESVSVSGKEISLKIKIFGNTSDVFAKTKANVTGNLSIKEGIRHVSVKALDNGFVQISE